MYSLTQVLYYSSLIAFHYFNKNNQQIFNLIWIEIRENSWFSGPVGKFELWTSDIWWKDNEAQLTWSLNSEHRMQLNVVKFSSRNWRALHCSTSSMSRSLRSFTGWRPGRPDGFASLNRINSWVAKVTLRSGGSSLGKIIKDMHKLGILWESRPTNKTPQLEFKMVIKQEEPQKQHFLREVEKEMIMIYLHA